MTNPVPIRRRSPSERVVLAWGKLGPLVQAALEAGQPLRAEEVLAYVAVLNAATDELALEELAR